MPFTPLVSDGFGRRKALAFGATIMLGGVALQVMSKNANMLIGSRVLGGLYIKLFTTCTDASVLRSWLWVGIRS